MLYKGKIFESHNIHLKVKTDKDNSIYIAYDNYLYRLGANDQLELKLNYSRRQMVKFVEDGLWLCEFARVDGDREASDFVDFYGLGKQYPSISECFALNQVPVIENKIFCRGRRGNQDRYLCSYNLSDNERKEVEGYYLHLSSDGQFLFTLTLRPRALTCFDLNLKQIWTYPHKDYGSKANQTPQFDGDLVLICPHKIIYAFNKGNGDLRWQHEFNFPPGSFTVENGLVYCEQEAHMVVFDAKTGSILVKENSGFIPFNPKEENHQSPNDISVTPIGKDKLYVGSSYEKLIKIFTADGKKCLQTIDLDKTDYPWGGFLQPIVVGDLIFQTVGSRNSQHGSGILMLTPTDDASDGNIEIEPRPPISIYAAPDLRREHGYQIYIGAKEIDLIQRYAGIAVVELLYETACIPLLEELKNGAFDNKHSGIIELIADPGSVSVNIDEIMQSLVDDVMAWVKSSRIVTSQSQKPISISYNFVKQSNWDQDGDLLDLDNARAAGKPLN